MIGPHRDFGIGAAFAPPARLLVKQRLNERNHFDVAVQMLGLDEGSIGLAPDIAQMGEMDARPEFSHHRDEVVVGARPERAGAKRHAVGQGRNGGEQCAIVGGGRDDARQAEQRERRIVGMDRQPRPEFGGDRRDLADEGEEIGPQIGGREPGVGAQSLEEASARVFGLARRHAADDVLFDRREGGGVARRARAAASAAAE